MFTLLPTPLGWQVRSVGNSQTLHETALVEAFNLKAAIEYLMKNFEATKEALTDMPPRGEEELDPVRALHQAEGTRVTRGGFGRAEWSALRRSSNHSTLLD
jgi:hypothetical protein